MPELHSQGKRVGRHHTHFARCLHCQQGSYLKFRTQFLGKVCAIAKERLAYYSAKTSVAGAELVYVIMMVSPTPNLKAPAFDPTFAPLTRICETSPPVTTTDLAVWRTVYATPLCGKGFPDRTELVKSVPFWGHGLEILPTGL